MRVLRRFVKEDEFVDVKLKKVMLVSLSSKLKGVYFFWHNGAIITLIKNRVIMRDPLRGSLENLLGVR